MNIKLIIEEEIKNILSEGLSKILYHYTYIPNLISILNSNQFATSSNLGSNADLRKSSGKYFFFSTSRAKGMSGYGSRHGTVAIVLNGQKLSEKYKGSPIDYWNYSSKRSDYSSDSDYINVLKSKELEDRIITNKPYIDNAKSYILEIHILAKTNRQDFIDKNEVREILNLANNIPVYFYGNENDYKLQNKAKAIQPEKLNIPDDLERYGGDTKIERQARDIQWFFKDIAPIIILKSDKKEAIENLLKQSAKEYGFDYTNIIDDITNKVRRLTTAWTIPEEEYLVLAAKIHNDRGNPNKYFRELLKLLIDDMKKWKCKNLEEYVIKKLKA
jgi:hypothetical protein